MTALGISRGVLLLCVALLACVAEAQVTRRIEVTAVDSEELNQQCKMIAAQGNLVALIGEIRAADNQLSKALQIDDLVRRSQKVDAIVSRIRTAFEKIQTITDEKLVTPTMTARREWQVKLSEFTKDADPEPPAGYVFHRAEVVFAYWAGKDSQPVKDRLQLRWDNDYFFVVDDSEMSVLDFCQLQHSQRIYLKVFFKHPRGRKEVSAWFAIS